MLEANASNFANANGDGNANNNNASNVNGVRLSHGFTWLKTRYLITSTGKIIKKIPRDVTKRERRKLKRLGEKVRNGEMTIEDYTNQYRSWRGDKRKYNAFHTLTNMDLYARRQTENGRENKTETSQTAGNH